MRLIIVFISVFALCMGVSAYAQTIVLIVNPENPVTDISSADVRKIFTGDKTVWEGGSSVQLVDWKGESRIRARFYSDIVGKSPSAVRRSWVEKVIVGNIYPPSVLASVDQIVDYVANHRWAIAYIEIKAVTRAVKTVSLDGRNQDDPEYGLK